MASARNPEPALAFVAALDRGVEELMRARDLLTPFLGPMQVLEQRFKFKWSDYYRAELGDDLWRSFLVCQNLCPAEALADLKLLTCRIESRMAHPSGKRTINLDPGLLTLHNMILASTKNQPQRIYLRDGIFAEVTLLFDGPGYRALERTYPEYGSPEMTALLGDLRKDYKRKLREVDRPMDPIALRSAPEEEYQ